MATLLLIVLLLVFGGGSSGKVVRAGGSNAATKKPNIVLILTDDQDIELGSLNFMPRTLRLLRAEGAEFRQAFVTTPMCCPSRSSLLTGMYVHNHHVFTNNDNCSSVRWQAAHEPRSFATYLSNAGYRTGYFGKYLNKYNGSYIPPGWREWGGLVMNSKYYNYSVNMNGKKIKHGHDYYKDYYTDLIANDSIAFLRQSKRKSQNKPVMLTMSFPAPHGPEDSAPQYAHLFFNVSTHHTPAYDFAPNPDKQWILQVTPRMLPLHRQFTDLLMTKRLQTLQSVDAAVERVYNELQALGELDNTYIIYTSDHGYHLGQFGLVKGKSFPFDFDVRVPFLVRGPFVEPGTIVDNIVLNIDLAPTFLDIAGVQTPAHMDGRSIMKLLTHNPRHGQRRKLKWPDTFLIESSGRRETAEQLADMKARNGKYQKNQNVELTTQSTDSVGDDVDDDDDEHHHESDDNDDDVDIEIDNEDKMDNIDTVSKTESQLDNRLIPDVVHDFSKHERLAVECQRSELQLPCQTGQKWHCVHEAGRWRKHKCKYHTHASLHATGVQTRKCACFTRAGLVYTRMRINTTALTQTQRRHHKRKIRSSVDHEDVDGDEHHLTDTTFLKTLLKHLLNISLLDTMSTKKKRNTMEQQVDSILKNMTDQLSELELTNVTFPEGGNSSLQNILKTNQIFEESVLGSSAPGCKVLLSGLVNCSTDVYEDRATWRRSRHHIESEIHQLRQKLDELKEIRRHLKRKRPQHDENEHSDRTTSKPFSSTVTPLQNRELDMHPIPNTTARPVTFTNHHRHYWYRSHLLSTTTEQSPPTTIAAATTSQKVNQSRMAVNEKNKSSELERNERLYPVAVSDDEHKHICYCESVASAEDDEETRRQQQLKAERLRKRERKQRRRLRLEKECISERMNCFRHDNDHWRTAPLWTAGPFCFCMNANNNTYSCVRTINATHNFLYCEFVTGLRTFYNLRIDPFEQQNRIDLLSEEEKSFLHNQLLTLIGCKGQSCTIGVDAHSQSAALPTSAVIASASTANDRITKKRKFFAQNVETEAIKESRVTNTSKRNGMASKTKKLNRMKNSNRRFHRRTLPSQ